MLKNGLMITMKRDELKALHLVMLRCYRAYKKETFFLCHLWFNLLICITTNLCAVQLQSLIFNIRCKCEDSTYTWEEVAKTQLS